MVNMLNPDMLVLCCTMPLQLFISNISIKKLSWRFEHQHNTNISGFNMFTILFYKINKTGQYYLLSNPISNLEEAHPLLLCGTFETYGIYITLTSSVKTSWFPNLRGLYGRSLSVFSTNARDTNHSPQKHIFKIYITLINCGA